MSVELFGYCHSVYSWIARLALHEKGVSHTWAEINPFDEHVSPAYLDVHPFKRVPALIHDGFALYETGAITRYIDEAFAGPPLQPGTPAARARMTQIISVVDSYGYWPLVRQVFSHGWFRPRVGRPADTEELAKGLEAAPRVLVALERLTEGDTYLVGGTLSLADIYLAPMLAYFTKVPDGAGLLRAQPKLTRWWSAMRTRASLIATAPHLPGAPGAA